MGRLTTHVLDTAAGKPAGGLRIKLHQWKNGKWILETDIHTNPDGRADQPLLEGASFVVGDYRLTFHVGDYFRSNGSIDAGKFLDQVPVDFHIADAESHYHVPLLCSPWAYSTYRGS